MLPFLTIHQHLHRRGYERRKKKKIDNRPSELYARYNGDTKKQELNEEAEVARRRNNHLSAGSDVPRASAPTTLFYPPSTRVPTPAPKWLQPE